MIGCRLGHLRFLQGWQQLVLPQISAPVALGRLGPHVHCPLHTTALAPRRPHEAAERHADAPPRCAALASPAPGTHCTALHCTVHAHGDSSQSLAAPADREERGSTRALASHTQGCQCHALASLLLATGVGALFPQKSAATLPCRVHFLRAPTVSRQRPNTPNPLPASSTTTTTSSSAATEPTHRDAHSAMASTSSAPAGATDAVLKPSEPVPEGVQQVQGIDFNQHAARPITVDELVSGYATMGFQATSVGAAVRIINDMVSWLLACFCPHGRHARASASANASVKCGDCTCPWLPTPPGRLPSVRRS